MASSLASALGRKALCPPTLIPRRKTTKATLPIVAANGHMGEPLYSGSLDSVSPGLADLDGAAISSGSSAQNPELHLLEICGLSIDEFWQAADALSAGLGKA